MTQVVLMVGTRKGCSSSRATGSAATGTCAARTATAGRSTTRSTTRESGTIYAAAASEWHGAGVWRSPDLGETLGALERGPRLRRGRRAEALEGLGPDGGPRARARRRRGGRPLREPRRRRDLVAAVSTLDGQPGRDDWNKPEQPAARAIWACRRSCPTPTTPTASGRSCRASASSRRPTTAARGRRATAGLRADWPLENPEVGYCVHKLVMSPADHDRLYQQNHCGMHRSDDARPLVDRDHRGAAERLRLRGRGAPARPRQLLRDPARPRPRPLHARRPRGGLAHERRRRRAGAARRAACRSATPTSACCARAWRSTRSTSPGLYFGTSTGQVFASADEGESWTEIASYLPGISSVEVAVIG